MVAAGWRSWREFTIDAREHELATRKAFKVMTRMLNVQLSRGWTRWRLTHAELEIAIRVADAQRAGNATQLKRTAARVFAGAETRMLVAGWRSWKEVVADMKQHRSSSCSVSYSNEEA